MQKSLTILSLVALGLTACQKDPGPGSPAPVASFTFNGSGPEVDELTVPTYSEVMLIDHSTKAVAYRYTLGNDSVRTTASPKFYYTQPGLYTVTLTVQGLDKQTATTTRRIRVLERVAKQVAITDLSDRVGSHYNLVNPTYWVVVRLGANAVRYPQPANGDRSFEAPIIYQSPKLTGLTAASLPFSLALPSPLTISRPAVDVLGPIQTVPNKFGYAGIGYGLELYGQDATGTYLLSTSYMPFYQSPAGSISEWGSDFEKRAYQLGYGDVYLRGNYE